MLNTQASNASGDPMTYAWDYGDGSAPGQGPAVLHAFAAAGEYTVTVTVSDASGNSTTGTVIVEVTEPGGGGTPTGRIGITKIKLKLNFKKADKDLLMVQGVILISEGFNPEGVAVDVDASGVFGSFVLDAKGKAKTDANGDKSKKFLLKLKIKKGVVQAGECKFKMIFKNGDFQDTWRRFGLENADIEERNVSIPMTVSFPTMMYPDFLAGKYKARIGKSGSYQAKELGLTLGG
jgi:PKD repeat protein